MKTDELLEEDFVCSCCYEILLEPTTLPCGHTFCRFCLAKWWQTSKRTECVECRRPVNEFPNVNFTLRFVYIHCYTIILDNLQDKYIIFLSFVALILCSFTLCFCLKFDLVY